MVSYWEPIIADIVKPLEDALQSGEIDKATNIEAVIHPLLSSLLIGSLMESIAIDSNILVDQLCRGIQNKAYQSSES